MLQRTLPHSLRRHAAYCLVIVAAATAAELVFLTGPSGAGKTTLLKLLFAAERPSEGQIVLRGRNIAQIPSVHGGSGNGRSANSP